MALDLVAIRQALAAQIRDGIAREVNVYDGYVPEAPTSPCVIVKPAAEYVTYASTLGDPVHTVNLEAWVLVSPGLGSDGQRIIDEFLSGGAGHLNSIYDAVVADITLGGVIDGDLTVTGVDYRDRLFLNDNTSFDWASVSVSITQT